MPVPPRRKVWFIDTSALLSLATDDGLRQAVHSELITERRVLLDVVYDELQGLAEHGDPGPAALATAALGQLEWLGEVVDTSQLVEPTRVLEIQDILRSGRSLRHQTEHWAESVIMAMTERLQHTDSYLLCEDYNARIESTAHGITPLSTHKLLSQMVRGGRLTAERAATFADAIKAAERGSDYTPQDFATGRLGRVGRP
ncbi:hypothetical protein ACWD4F_41490 [Streptomyces aureus]